MRILSKRKTKFGLDRKVYLDRYLFYLLIPIFFLVHPLLCSLSTGLNKLPPGSWLICGRPRNCAVTSTRSAASNAAGLSSMILQSNLIQIIRFYTRQYVISRKVKFKFPAVEFKSMIPNPENGFHL
jgi:hypothetical protein